MSELTLFYASVIIPALACLAVLVLLIFVLRAALHRITSPLADAAVDSLLAERRSQQPGWLVRRFLRGRPA